MLCPKCKTKVEELALRCPSCGIRVRTKCPDCGTLNKINALNCSTCGKELLKKCSSCGAYNLPTAKLCRKCGQSLSSIKPETKIETDTIQTQSEETILTNTTYTETVPKQNIEPEQFEQTEIPTEPTKEEQAKYSLEEDEGYSPEPAFSEQTVPENVVILEKEQFEVKDLVVNALINSENVFCSLIAPEGFGKSYILDYIKQDLQNANINLLSMEATPITQLSPYGLFQDLFLSACGLPNYFVEGQQKEADVVKVLEQSFGLASNDAYELFNLLYPSKTAYYEEILHSRNKIKTLIKKIFINAKSAGEIVLTIDDFDMIDASSFELLAELYNDGIIDENLKLLVSVQNQKNVDGFIQKTQIAKEKFEKFVIGKLTRENSKNLIKNILNGFNPLPETLCNKIIENAKGSPLYIGQVLLYMNESGMFNFDGTTLSCTVDEQRFIPPADISAAFTRRIEQIKTQAPPIYKALIIIAILGIKFNTTMLQAAMEIDQSGMEELVKALMSLAFIKPYNQQSFVFSSAALWRYLFDYIKKDFEFAKIAANLAEKIDNLRLSNTAYKPLLAQDAGNSQKAFDGWTQIMRITSYIGDVSLYALAQKQCLKLNESLNMPIKQVIELNIKTRLGKLLCKTEPELTLNFLSSVLGFNLEINNPTAFIDIASYAVIAANKAGNYNAVIEIVDNVIKLIQPAENYKLEIALITARKIRTMLYLGNFEQVINIIENDIKPALEDALSQNYTVSNLPISKIFETWLEVNFVLADALLLQGNNKVYNIIADLDEAMSTHGAELGQYVQKLNLTRALACTLKGETTDADNLLAEIGQKAATELPDLDFACRFNLVQILNTFMKKEFANIKSYLFDAVTFANNSGDFMGKNLLKSALGLVLENEGDFSKAFEIYNDQITYFAKERIAVGALLTWYLIADLCLKVSDIDKSLEIAMNALDVAKNPKINSYYFQVMYKRLIAEIYLIKGDFDASKMYMEKALLITKKFNLDYLHIMLYDFNAKYHIEMFKLGKDNGSSPLVQAKKLYEKAINLASKLGHMKLVDELKQEYQSLLTFAQLKKVVLN